MRPLIDREKRTIRIAVIGLAMYLVLFFGVRGWRGLEARRSEYEKLVRDAERVRQELHSYENKILLLDKLKETFRLDPSKLSRETLVAAASAAIQKAATAGAVQLGPIRESAARGSSKELASMQIEGVGPVPAMMTLLHRLQTLGYPLVIDAVQINGEPTKPGMIKMNITIVILDYEQWKQEEKRNA
ncbi:MAG: hypothetical protein L0Z50_11940 [Verrucomicrobiales bacterium]|nr:hypothetical protein [Verrucomicrobiales bacterium]